MWEIWTNELLPKALKSCPKSNKLPNLVTLLKADWWAFEKTKHLGTKLTVNKCSILISPMTGFEPRTAGIRSDRSTNWATTTALSSKVTFFSRHRRLHRKPARRTAPTSDHHHPHLGRLRCNLRCGSPRQRLDHLGHPEEQVYAHAHQCVPRQPRHLWSTHPRCR